MKSNRLLVASLFGAVAWASSSVLAVPTMKVYFTPVPAQGTTGAYPAGSFISGQVLTAPSGGFTSYWNVQIEDWDPNGDSIPLLRTWQVKIDALGFSGANASPSNPGCDLVYPYYTQGCPSANAAGAAVCAAKFGETGTWCSGAGGYCDWAFQNRGRADWVLASQEGTPSGLFPVVNGVSPTGPIFAATTDPGSEILDLHHRYYAGTLVLPVPACAMGTYTMCFKFGAPPETFAQDQQNPAADIPIASAVCGQLVIDPALASRCGNNVREGSEQCDGTADSACPGACRADCTCGIIHVGGACCTAGNCILDQGNIFDPPCLGTFHPGVSCTPGLCGGGGTCSPDADGDGIQDSVDSLPSSSNEYFDPSTNPYTVGAFVSRGNQNLCVSNALPPYGVNVRSLSGGSMPASANVQCSVPGDADVKVASVTAGTCVTLTCRTVGTSASAEVKNPCPPGSAANAAMAEDEFPPSRRPGTSPSNCWPAVWSLPRLRCPLATRSPTARKRWKSMPRPRTAAR